MKIITTKDPDGVTQVAVEERPQQHEGRQELRSPDPRGKP